MSEIGFSDLLIVTVVAFSAPFVLGLVPGLRLPAVVVEIVAGIAIGPSGFGWVEIDEPIDVLSLIGLAFLLFLAGLEIDFHALRGRLVGISALGFAASFGLGLAVALILDGLGQVDTPLLVAIILVATSLGIVVPVLKDSDQIASGLGQLVITAASIADFGAVILLSLFFSREATSTSTKLVLLGGFFLVAGAFALAIVGAERSGTLAGVLLRLQDTTAQIRVRGAFVLLVAFVALAESLGLEAILGAFLAGAVVSLVDRDRMLTHPTFRTKLEAVGYGVFIPVFFVASGIRFDLGALFSSASTVVRVPVFLIALLAVRGLPALLYRSLLGRREVLVAALLQATSLPFIVAASMIGMQLDLLDKATGAALIAAGLLSVLLFPLLALSILRGAEPAPLEAGQLSGAATVEPTTS
jgi:Kef-type K+ transport system membrane component KefB